ncbi:MAG: FAD-dependent thymidylate synthase [Rhodospirillales bacterium]|nr:FAD-dependent thymidylate synthase [Rhodospirillales bacterium]
MTIDDRKRAEIEAQRAASHETRRATVQALEAILYEHFVVLDHGFVRVIDYMGDDAAIVQAARVSYGAGTRHVREDRALIRYLLRHRHTTPFEMCELKLHIKAPIFVARQWLRHRTASVNEYSARYSKLDREFYVPDAAHLKLILDERRLKERGSMKDLFERMKVLDERSALATQSEFNKQGRDDALSDNEARHALSRFDDTSKRAYAVYKNLLNENTRRTLRNPSYTGLARELARAVLPVNYYTQFYWKIDLHNLLHFLSLRADDHAQYEIRAYAEVILDKIVMRWVPATYEAFRDYGMDAVSLSAGALDVVKRMLAKEDVNEDSSGLSKREWRELMAVLGREP